VSLACGQVKDVGGKVSSGWPWRYREKQQGKGGEKEYRKGPTSLKGAYIQRKDSANSNLFVRHTRIRGVETASGRRKEQSTEA